MKKIILSGLLLIILSTGGWAEEEPLPTKFPTIVIKGKDKSYLEVIRKRSTGKALRTEYLPEKELSFPSLSPSLEKKASYLPPSPFLKESLSYLKSKVPSPLPAVSFKLPSLSFKEKRFIEPEEPKEALLSESSEKVLTSSEKELSFPSLLPSLEKKASYLPPSPFLKESLSYLKSKAPSPLPAVSFKFPSLSFKEKRFIEPEEPKEALLSESSEKVLTSSEKELSFPSPSPSLEKKASYLPPALLLKIPTKKFSESKAPSPLPAVSFKLPSLSSKEERFIEPEEPKEAFLSESSEKVLTSSEKELSFPSPQISLGEKVFPISKEKSLLPYLHLYTYFTTRKNFSYQLNYGRSMEESSYLLSIHRDYFPSCIEYKGKILDKDTDGMMIESYWDLSQKKKNYLGLETSRGKIGLTGQEKINKEKFKIKGGQRSDTFRLEGEIGNLWIGYPDEKQEGISLRAQTELQIKETSLSIGLNFNGENLNSNSYNETHLWLRGGGITFSGEKNLILTTRTGVKWVENQKAEFLPYLKILYLINPQMRIQLIRERIFSLPRFEELYLENDYAQVNAGEEFLSTPRDFWNYEINWDYEISSRMNIYLEVFRKEGNDIIWSQEDLLTKPLNRKILLQGGRVTFWHCFNDNFQQEIIFTYYTDREMKSVEEDTGISEMIHGYPRSKGELWLKWENDDWKIEVGGEVVGERYYREDTMETLPSGWKEKLRISKNLGKDVEFSVEWQRNNYELLKDYSLPSEKIILELKARLF